MKFSLICVLCGSHRIGEVRGRLRGAIGDRKANPGSRLGTPWTALRRGQPERVTQGGGGGPYGPRIVPLRLLNVRHGRPLTFRCQGEVVRKEDVVTKTPNEVRARIAQ